MKTDSRVAYRKDIEGLRAVAVLPVVAYHVGFTAVPGGFIGVDVFFVISGFLITQLLQADIQAGEFSLMRFYERRIRRIGPALFATLAVTFALGMLYCLPDELADLSKSLVAAAASVSNFYFWSTSGYCDGDAASKPLLHTWSLAVEEQFYLLWPLYLWLGQRYLRQRFIPVTVAIALVSFAVSAVGAFRFANSTFYLPGTRLWELAAGGLIALGAVPVITSAAARNLLAMTGLVLIAGSALLIRGSMPFPGLLALPPCLGAAMVIVAGRGGSSVAGRLLALPPMAFVGAISYSLYMWHWPITVFQKNYALFAAGLTLFQTKLLIVGLSFAAATLSWRFIEQPFRTRQIAVARPMLLRLAGVSFGILMAVGVTASARGGFPARFTAQELETVAHLTQSTHGAWRPDRCFLYKGHPGEKFAPECLALLSGHKNYLLLGDSHAAELWSGLSAAFPDVNFLQATAANCFPTLTHALNESPQCVAVLDEILQGLLPHTRIDQVVIIARWKPGTLPALGATLDWLKAHEIPVTLMGPTAVYDAPVPRLVVFAMRARDPGLLTRHLDFSLIDLDAQMARLASDHSVPYISLLNLECVAARCADNSEAPEIFDQEHFNVAGSKLMAQKLRTAYPAFGS